MKLPVRLVPLYEGSSLEGRIADMTMLYCAGDKQTPLNWLRALGCDVHVFDETIVVDGLTGIRVGLTDADPVTCAVQFGFALAGPFWPQVYPRLLGEVNRRWKAKSKTT